jgi:hypothetical protein
VPVAKKNREHLPKESKPIFFELKKYFRKKSQWTSDMYEVYGEWCKYREFSTQPSVQHPATMEALQH